MVELYIRDKFVFVYGFFIKKIKNKMEIILEINDIFCI